MTHHQLPSRGQVWTANDPRRLRAVEVIQVVHNPDEVNQGFDVYVRTVYPGPGRVQLMTRGQFKTGSKGYSRLS